VSAVVDADDNDGLVGTRSVRGGGAGARLDCSSVSFAAAMQCSRHDQLMTDALFGHAVDVLVSSAARRLAFSGLPITH